jgi:hypothetical protein
MNERIRQLADEVANLMPAGVYTIEYESGKSGVEFTEDALEKFAELIIKECMGCCGQVAEDAHKQKSSSFLTQDGKQLYNGVWGGAMNCGSAIANHFGVK